jgi:hypothetical protein
LCKRFKITEENVMLVSSRIGEIFIGRALAAATTRLTGVQNAKPSQKQMRQIAGVVRAVHE